MSGETMEVRDAAAGYAVEAGQKKIQEYQQTDIGLLPRDWALESLSEIAEIQTGIAKNSKAEIGDGMDVLYLRVANIQNGFLDLREMKKIRIPRSELQRYSVLPGDLLMNEGGDLDKLGRAALWNGEFHPCVHQNHVFVVRCKPAVHSSYLAAWCLSETVRKFLSVSGSQTTNLASINKTALSRLPVAVPTLEEQRAIATALSDVDALITALDRLIAKKRAIRTAAMQQLLTGKTRLPGFSGQWETMRLGDIAEIIMGQSPSSTNYNAKGIGLPLVQGNADIRNRITIKRIFTTQITKRGKRRCADVSSRSCRRNCESNFRCVSR